MPDIIMHKRLICVDSAFNQKGHNKFWYVTVYDNGDVKSEWGRVGNTISEKVDNKGNKEAALSFAEKKMKTKMRGKTNKSTGKKDSQYEEVEIIGAGPEQAKKVAGKQLENLAAKQIAGGNKKIEKLVKYLADKNIHNITKSTTLIYNKDTGLFSTPLGVVGQKNIDEARKLLIKLSKYVSKGLIESKIAIPILDRYLTFIPQSTGMNRPSLRLLVPSTEALRKQNDILDSLQASLDFMLTSPPSKEEEKKQEETKIWDISLAEIEDDEVIKRITKKYKSTAKNMHACYNLKIKNVYKIQITKMHTAFQKASKKFGNVMELWHGTRVGNLLSILARGMIIPPSNASYCTGRMFGNGAYFASSSTKSLNYAYGYWGGSIDNNCFMFLTDVAMGKPYIPKSYTGSLPKPGYDSTWAKAKKSGVANDEFIVYSVDQCDFTFLIEFGR